MEEQAVNNQIQQPPVSLVPVSKKPNQWLIAAIILAIIIFIGGVYILSAQSQKRIYPPPPEPPLPPKITSQPSPIINETANWKTYIFPDNTFSFKYPSDWEYEVTDFVFIIKGKEYPTTYIRFGEPIAEEERRQFGYIDINDAPKVYNKFSLNYASHTDFTNLTVDNLVEELINKRSSIVDDPTTLLFNNDIQAKEVGYACQEYCVDILFKNNTTIFDTSTGPSGSVLTQRQILSTFKFTPASPTGGDQEGIIPPQVCIQDVKLCPDGKTYVGRQGPTCEFAPCP